MALYQVKLPKMGESVAEATITKWLKAEGDAIAIDEELVEIATDKVDSDVTSEVEGVIKELHFKENEVVPVGNVIAVIETNNTLPDHLIQEEDIIEQEEEIEDEGVEIKKTPESVAILSEEIQSLTLPKEEKLSTAEKYFSPLVRSIAKKEGISTEELQSLNGSGKEGRITKKDIFSFLEKRKTITNGALDQKPMEQSLGLPKIKVETTKEDRIHTLSRTEKLISEHMQMSLHTSAHVQSFIEADVTDLWNWRESAKNNFIKQEGAKLTFTPLFMMAVIKALKDYPQLNSSVNGDQVVIKKNINLGMATALSDGNLIVPVIKNADHLNLVGLAKVVNDLADRARSNKLKPYEVQEGSYTLTNIGNFGSLMGTPIINQPQVGILAIGTIQKTPAVIETPKGDFIGIRRKVMLSHSYDHRIINGATGGLFVKQVAEYLENWNEKLPY